MSRVRVLASLFCALYLLPQVLIGASVDSDLSGTRLGEAHYQERQGGLRKPAIRIYLRKAEGDAGAYYAVLIQYANLPTIMPQYLAARTLPVANQLIGYLNHITDQILIYKVTPGSLQGHYQMRPVTVTGNAIKVAEGSKPRLLILSRDATAADPLSGAAISSSTPNEPEIRFPKAGDGGIQYRLASLTYQKAKLESTWRENFLAGPYLAAYGKLDDEVLRLESKDGQHAANFFINPKFANVPMRKRQAVFTHPGSAFLSGNYQVSEPVNGMFLLTPTQDAQPGSEDLGRRIGMFIDIFDATKSLNQDVVELVFVNPSNPQDFMMYYEHPENGDARPTSAETSAQERR